MMFKARMRVSGEYLGDTDFVISPKGDVLSRNSAGVTIKLDAELLPVVEKKSFCQFCGVRNKS